MDRLRIAALAVLLAATSGFPVTAQEPPAPVPEKPAEAPDHETLVSWMTGGFSSAAQAAGDSDFFDIRLHMVPIWPDRDDGAWLYVEQAVAGELERPYRQRVYHVTEVAAGLFQSKVYTFEDPLRFAGARHEDDPLTGLSPDDLTARDGCSILMRRRGDRFIGSTLGSLCTSEMRGASYATSEVIITAHGLISWDRGWDADGHQVWGAEKGGYIFDRIAVPPEPAPASTPAPGEE